MNKTHTKFKLKLKNNELNFNSKFKLKLKKNELNFNSINKKIINSKNNFPKLKLFFNKTIRNFPIIGKPNKFNIEYSKKVNELTYKSKKLTNYIKLNYPNYSKLKYPAFRKLSQLINEKDLDAKSRLFEGLKQDLKNLEKKNPGKFKKLPFKVKSIKYTTGNQLIK